MKGLVGEEVSYYGTGADCVVSNYRMAPVRRRGLSFEPIRHMGRYRGTPVTSEYGLVAA
jgi:hypothetical protein